MDSHLKSRAVPIQVNGNPQKSIAALAASGARIMAREPAIRSNSIGSRHKDIGYAGDSLPPTSEHAEPSSASTLTISIPSASFNLSTNTSIRTDRSQTSASASMAITRPHRLMSVLVEPSSSVPSSPTQPSSPTSPSSSTSTSESTFFTAETTLSSQASPSPTRLNYPWPPPSPTTSDSSESTVALEFVSLPPSPQEQHLHQHQWPDGRFPTAALTRKERVKRRWNRLRAAQTAGSAPQEQEQQRRPTAQVPQNPSWRLTLDEPSVSLSSSVQTIPRSNSKPISLLSQFRPSSHTSGPIPIPYPLFNPTVSSTHSFSSGHTDLGRRDGATVDSAATAVTVPSVQSERQATRGLFPFSKRKSKAREVAVRSPTFVDGEELDETEVQERERGEMLGSWEVLNESARAAAGPSRARSNLTLQPHFNIRLGRIPLLDYETRAARRRRRHDMRVDPFPISPPEEPLSPSDSESSLNTPRPASPPVNLRSFTPSIPSFRVRPLSDTSHDQPSTRPVSFLNEQLRRVPSLLRIGSLHTLHTTAGSNDSSVAQARSVDTTHVTPVAPGLASSRSVPLAALRPLFSVPTPPESSTGHHYPGRPLPNVPYVPSLSVTSAQASTSVLAATWESNSETRNHTHHRTGNVPEGLLINFDGDDDDDPVDIYNNSSSISMISSASNTSEGSDLETLLQYFLQGYPTTQAARQIPIAQNQSSNVQPSSSSSLSPSPPARSPPSPSALVGRIEVEVENQRLQCGGRSRDHGFAKLKLSLLGLAVESCGICLSQFEVGELAALGLGCQHAFHEHCLKTWLARSHTCPFCRAPLHISGSYDNL